MSTTAKYGSPETHPYRVGAILHKTLEDAIAGAKTAAAKFDIALEVIARSFVDCGFDYEVQTTVAIVMPDGEVVR